MFTRFLTSFGKDQRGNVAVIAALLILPILMLSGVGVEYTRISAARGQMQTVVDSSVLNSGMDFANRKAAANRIAAMINANSGRDTARVKISINQDKLRVDAWDQIDTPLLSTIGQTTSPIDVSLEIPVPGSSGEVTDTASGKDQRNSQQKLALRRVERQLERAIKRLNSKKTQYPAQQRKLRIRLERQLSEVRRQIRNLG